MQRVTPSLPPFKPRLFFSETPPNPGSSSTVSNPNSALNLFDRMPSSPPPDNALELFEIVEDDDDNNDPGLVLGLRDNLKLDLSGFPIDPSPSPSLDLGPVIVPRRLNPDHELRVGQTFGDVSSCRRALRDAAIACNFEIQTVKSDKTRFTAKCAGHGCPWRVHAAKLPGQPTFSIRTISAAHTCDGITHLGHQQASVQWVASSVEQWLRENPHCKPKDILEEVHRVHGIRLSYKQAWRGKERVIASVHGSFEEEYRLLPKYCEEIKRTNPGSIASVYGNEEDGRFQRLFIAYHASIYGFVNGCRPVIGLDKVVLKNRYLGTLLLASGFDGEGALFPLAFGVIDEETDENWTWFLTELRLLLELNTVNMLRLTILSDMQKGVFEAVSINFPSAFHGLCMRHLTESFQKEFNNNMLVGLLWDAAQALTVVDFDAKMMEINALSPQAAYWLNSIQYQLWATAHFKGSRFGLMTANLVESPNYWMLEASSLPIIQMMECIRRQLMTWFSDRREMSDHWSNLLVPSALQHVSDARQCAQEYQVMQVNEVGLGVYSPHEGITNTVDIRNRCCSCCGWQLYGLPCSHAVAALISCGQNVYKFTENYFTVTTYRNAYSEIIHPIPDKRLWNVKDQVELVINPPRFVMSPVKQRKKRVRSHDGRPLKRVVHCSRCKQTGHFRSTCSSPA